MPISLGGKYYGTRDEMKTEQAITKNRPPCSSNGVEHTRQSRQKKVNRLHSKPPPSLPPTAKQREETR